MHVLLQLFGEIVCLGVAAAWALMKTEGQTVRKWNTCEHTVWAVPSCPSPYWPTLGKVVIDLFWGPRMEPPLPTFHRQVVANKCDGCHHVPIDFSCGALEAATWRQVKMWKRFLVGGGSEVELKERRRWRCLPYGLFLLERAWQPTVQRLCKAAWFTVWVLTHMFDAEVDSFCTCLHTVGLF